MKERGYAVGGGGGESVKNLISKLIHENVIKVNWIHWPNFCNYSLLAAASCDDQLHLFCLFELLNNAESPILVPIGRVSCQAGGLITNLSFYLSTTQCTFSSQIEFTLSTKQSLLEPGIAQSTTKDFYLYLRPLAQNNFRSTTLHLEEKST